jgi:predicted RNA-binding protein
MTFEQVDAMDKDEFGLDQSNKNWSSCKIGGLDAAIKEATLLGKPKNIPLKIIQNTIKILDLLAGFPFVNLKKTVKMKLVKNYKLLQEVKQVNAKNFKQCCLFKLILNK